MVSRFGTYLLSQKLAKGFLFAAEEKLKRKETSDAIHCLIRSVREFQTATNCLASLMFEKKRKTK